MSEIQRRICKLDFTNFDNCTEEFRCEFDANQYGGYDIEYDNFGIKQININNCYGDGILAKVRYTETVHELDIHQHIANKVSDALHPWLDYKHAISLDFENGLTIFQQSSSRYLSWVVRHVDARNKYDNRILYQLYYGDGAIRNQIQGYDILAFKPVEHSWYCLLNNVKTYEE